METYELKSEAALQRVPVDDRERHPEKGKAKTKTAEAPADAAQTLDRETLARLIEGVKAL